VTAMSFAGAIVIKNDGECGMPGSDANGNAIFGGIGQVTTQILNNNRIMLVCKGTGRINDSGRGQHFSRQELLPALGYCEIDAPDGTSDLTTDASVTVAANGNGEVHCTCNRADLAAGICFVLPPP